MIDFFDRIAIVHLPERTDRHEGLARDLRLLKIDIKDPKVDIPHAPRPESANGFPSRGVYGNFLSHHAILKDALDKRHGSVLVLEDDAIFSRRFANRQDEYVEQLRATDWDLCYFGHPLKKELREYPRGLVPYSGAFIWAHCYAVHSRVLGRLVEYLALALERPPGHPKGGRLYIDGAFTMFREQNTDVLTLVANPALSVQKGCPSSLANGRWYDRIPSLQPFVSRARAARDELWRWTN